MQGKKKNLVDLYAHFTRRPKHVVRRDLELLSQYRQSFEKFCLEFFRHGSGWLYPDTKALPPFLKEAINLAEDPGSERVCIALPRGHMKTTIFGKIYPIWKILLHPEECDYVVIFVLSEKNTRSIRNAHEQIFFNPYLFDKLQYFFPYFFSRPMEEIRANPVEKINEKELVLWNGCRIEYESITAESRGLSSQGRPKLIILDDIVPTEAEKSETMRSIPEDRFFSVIEPMGEKLPSGKKAKIVLLGTVVHREDLVNRILTGEIPGWKTLKKAAYDPDANMPLWPEKWTMEELLEKRKQFERAGKLAKFYREYMNEPAADTNYPWAEAELPFWDNRLKKHRGKDLYYDHLYRTVWVDHASGTGGDDFVVVEIGHTPDGEVLLLDLFASNSVSLQDRLAKVYHFVKRRRPHVFGIEWTSESISFIQALEKFLRDRGIRLAIETPRPQKFGSKNERILTALSPWVHDQSLYLPLHHPDTERFLTQMRNFCVTDKDNRDDMLDALAWALLHTRKPKLAEIAVAPQPGTWMYNVWKAMHQKHRKTPDAWPTW